MGNPIFDGKFHYKWPFSIAMLNYQRVPPYIHKHVRNRVVPQRWAEPLAQEVPTLLGSFPQRASVKGGTMLEINGGHRDDKRGVLEYPPFIDDDDDDCYYYYYGSQLEMFFFVIFHCHV